MNKMTTGSSLSNFKIQFNNKKSWTVVLALIIFVFACQKDTPFKDAIKNPINPDPNSRNSHENVAKILSGVFEDSDGQEIYLSTLKQHISSQTDTSIHGVYSIPLMFLLDKSSSNHKAFYQLWDSIAASIGADFNSHFLMTEYIPSFPGMGVSIFDPKERLEKNLIALDQNFELALADPNESETLKSFKNGSFKQVLTLSSEPEVMTLILQENEGYWMLNSDQINSENTFFEATGTSVCDQLINNIQSLNLNPYKGTSNVKIGDKTYDNPLENYILVAIQDATLRSNKLCSNNTETNIDPNVSAGSRQSNQVLRSCDRDLWQNMTERIIRFKFDSPGAKSLLSNTECNWPSKLCRFLIIRTVPKANENKTAYYIEAKKQVFIASRTWLAKGGWCYTNDLDFGQWSHLEGKMGDYMFYSFIQLNKKVGVFPRTLDLSGNGAPVKFLTLVDGVYVETYLYGENRGSIIIKYTSKDQYLGNELVNYCDCQRCNGWQGDTYSPGSFLFSIRECSNLPDCQFNQ